MTDGTIRGFRHEARAAVADSKKIDAQVKDAVFSALAGEPGLKKKEQEANLNAALSALEGVEGKKAAAAREAVESALDVIAERRAAKKASA